MGGRAPDLQKPDPRARAQGAFCASRTRMVNALKVALPLAALAVLSTMFLISDKADPDAALPYAQVDVDKMTREPRLGRPTYSGTTADGSAVVLSASNALPGADGAVSAQALNLRLTTPQGLIAHVLADQGGVDAGGRQIELAGGVRLSTSTGYSLATQSMTASTTDSRLTAPGTVTATAPFGRLTAGAMTLHGGETGAHVLDFTGGVRLIYQPQQE
ncbi:LPS export ABC transporter periplasmic protein LptC [Paracoccus sp. p4-l81]|uniref:LPS export ABC transporter periplasmic protein LptC n=1 Tax=unclassified Paracoccus (in: a-proteobacteria) TaxID=2688777 RepID=UPI0035BB1D09